MSDIYLYIYFWQESGDGPIHIAARLKNVEICKMLVQSGAKVDSKNVRCYLLTIQSCHDHIFRYFWIRTVLFLCGFAFRPHVSGECGMGIRNFLNPLSKVEIFVYAKNPKSCGRSNPGIFLIRWQDKIGSSLSAKLARLIAHAPLTIFTDTCWHEHFWIGKEKVAGFKNIPMRMDGAWEARRQFFSFFVSRREKKFS